MPPRLKLPTLPRPSLRYRRHFDDAPPADLAEQLAARPSPGVRPVRVMHFSDTYLPRRDGIVTSVRTLTTTMTAAGHPSLLIVPRHPDQEPEPGVLPVGSMPCGVADMRLSWPRQRHVAWLAQWRPDLVHIHTPGPVGLLGLLAGRQLGLPIVHTYHTDLHAYADAYRVPSVALRAIIALYAARLSAPRPPVADTRERRVALVDAGTQLLLGDADAVVAPTSGVLARAGLAVPTERMFVVPTGVAMPSVAPVAGEDFRRQYGIAPDAPVALFVGRVHAEKGIDLLIPAFARVVAALPQARLVLIGAVYERRWLDKLLTAHGVARQTIVVGEQPPEIVAAGYSACQVFAFPSQTDTQGLVVQEAALAGRPALLADPLLHASGPLGDAAALAPATVEGYGDALLALLADPVAARRLGEAAQMRAGNHTPARYAEAMHQVYQYVLERNGRLT